MSLPLHLATLHVFSKSNADFSASKEAFFETYIFANIPACPRGMGAAH